MRVELTFWNRWVKPRREDAADGTTTVFFGFGKLSWRGVVGTYRRGWPTPPDSGFKGRVE